MSPKWCFGVTMLLMLLVGAFYFHWEHVGRIVLPRWPVWANLFYSTCYSASELRKARFCQVHVARLCFREAHGFIVQSLQLLTCCVTCAPKTGKTKRTLPPPKEDILENFSGRRRSLFRQVVDTKTPKQPGKPYLPPKSFLCGPHVFCQRKVPRWSRLVYGFFSLTPPTLVAFRSRPVRMSFFALVG